MVPDKLEVFFWAAEKQGMLLEVLNLLTLKLYTRTYKFLSLLIKDP